EGEELPAEAAWERQDELLLTAHKARSGLQSLIDLIGDSWQDGAGSLEAEDPRIQFDRWTWSITLDGKRYSGIDAKAFQLYEVIFKAPSPPVTRAQIRAKVQGL